MHWCWCSSCQQESTREEPMNISSTLCCCVQLWLKGLGRFIQGSVSPPSRAELPVLLYCTWWLHTLPLSGLPLSQFLWELSVTCLLLPPVRKGIDQGFPEGFVLGFSSPLIKGLPLQHPFVRNSQLVAMFSGTVLQFLCVPSLLCTENAQTDRVCMKS